MKKAFTLIELLTVIALMALLGTTAVGGYRAMQRGMEQKGVMQNANAAIRAAFQRAQIDRQPTLIYFWNELISEETEDENAVVVGRAVAIRRHGRISDVDGNYLIDEFGDLERSYPVVGGSDSSAGSRSEKGAIYLYPMNKFSEMSGMKRTLVKGSVVDKSEELESWSGKKLIGDNKIPAYAFEIVDKNGVDWKPGHAYGLEFLSIQLPRGYIFGSDYPKTMSKPVSFVDALVFKPGTTSSNGTTSGGIAGSKSQIEIYYLKSTGATLTPVSIGKTDNPQ